MADDWAIGSDHVTERGAPADRIANQLPAPLFDAGPADEHTLTDRQRVALLELRHHDDGLTAQDVGQAAHVHRGAHDDRLCNWCGREGRQLLHALERKGLAQRRKGLWYAARTDEWAAQEDGRYDPATSEWPNGF